MTLTFVMCPWTRSLDKVTWPLTLPQVCNTSPSDSPFAVLSPVFISTGNQTASNLWYLYSNMFFVFSFRKLDINNQFERNFRKLLQGKAELKSLLLAVVAWAGHIFEKKSNKKSRQVFFWHVCVFLRSNGCLDYIEINQRLELHSWP